MNLIDDKFIPVCREDGTKQRIAPYQITETENPIIQLDSPRPDFNGALLQFLIGLLQTTAMPEDHNSWIKLLENPPLPEDLKKSFSSKYHFAFELKGEKGYFMQDSDPLDDQKESPIYQLLMNFPGDNTIEKNKDHFIKRDRVKALCPACAVTALFTLQTNAPSGGKGHRTSLRGGGPLTTLLVTDTKAEWPDNRRLWRDLWLNVLDRESFENTFDRETDKNQPEDIFPWLAPTRTSERDQSTTPEDVNLLQMYWGMPLRIRLLWDSSFSGICDLCGEKSPHLLKEFKKKNYGTNYKVWEHFLSPYFEKNKKSKESKTACKLKEDRISYQHWPQYVADDLQNGTFCAKVVSRYHRTIRWPDQLRLLAFGYEMDNAKALSYYEVKMPLFHLKSDIRSDFSKRVQSMTKASSEIVKCLNRAIKQAWFSEKDKRSMPYFIKNQFFQKTEEDFFRLLKKLNNSFKGLSNENGKDILGKWYLILKKSAVELFDYQTKQGDFFYADPKRIVKAKQGLEKFLWSKKIKSILLLS